MQNLQHIIGVDLSKRTIDLASHQLHCHVRIENSKIGFKQMLKWMKAKGINTSEVMFVMEHTGLYSFCFENFLHDQNIAFSKVSALVVKRSVGVVRGKSDKIDAKRLADYGLEKKNKLTIETQNSKELQRLQLLYTTRERLVRHKASLLNSMSEYKNIGLPASDSIMSSQTKLIRQFEKEIKKLEVEMDDIIQSDPSIRQNQSLLRSIKGVGKVLSIATIIKTKNFTRFPNARKFAWLCF